MSFGLVFWGDILIGVVCFAVGAAIGGPLYAKIKAKLP